ncbi:MAG TPA: putative motility protein [Xanthobacteraceae bacterium]|nr:putative motility protein [Xanthobacteraceae bacterium]
MDMSAVMAAIGMQAGQTQQAVAMRMIKMNADAEAAAVQTLLGVAPPGPAALPEGVGAVIDRLA